MYTLLLFFLILFSLLITRLPNRESGIVLRFKSMFEIRLSLYYLWAILLIAPLVYAYTYRSYRVGSDTLYIYYNIYYLGYAASGWKIPMYEGIFIRGVKLLYYIFPSFQFMLFAVALFICGVFSCYFLKHKKEYNFIVAIVAFFVWIFCPSLNIMRQILAVAICFIGTCFLEKRKVGWAIFFYIVGCFFHIVSVVMFVFPAIYFLGRRELWKKYLPILCFFAPIVVMVTLRVVIKLPIFSKFQSAIGAYSVANINMKFLIFPLLFLPIIFANWNKLIELKRFNYVYLCGTILIYTAICLSGFLWYAFRVMYFFIPSEIIIISQLGKCYGKKGEWLVNCYIIAVTVIVFYLIYVYWGTDGIYPFSLLA